MDRPGPQRATIGTVDELRAKGGLTGKVGSVPVCAFWNDGQLYAVDDRCPHMGFPLHRGTVENGLLTYHWHHARFDLASGGTLDPFEALDHLGWDHASEVLPTLAHGTAGAGRSEESGQWRHPHDLPTLLGSERPIDRPSQPAPGGLADADLDPLAAAVLGDDPGEILDALDGAAERGATLEQLARAVALAAALRLVRFHTQNDHGDWDVIHHGFTTANATHQLLGRAPTPELARGIYHSALKVFLDRFLNVPPARLPAARAAADGRPDLAALQDCWDREGRVDEAGAIVYGWLRLGGEQAAVVAALGAALLAEDAEFHWFQTYEAAVRQAGAWPEGSEPAALILTAAARFLAAHTPTRRELSQVVRIATRLRRGDELYEEL